MTALMRVADRLLHLQPNVLRSRTEAEKIGTRPRVAAPPPRRLRRRWRIDEDVVDGRPVLTLAPRGTTRDVTLVYLHGGAYVNELVAPQWRIIDELARGTGATVVVPRYGLAPEHHVDDAFALMSELMAGVRRERPADRVFLAGDSAGAGLALALAVEGSSSRATAARSDLRPDGLFLFSPWVDVTMTNPAARRMEAGDAMLGVDGLRLWGREWAGTRDVDDPRVSPALGELSGLPPTWVYQGGRDLFLPDVEIFAGNARAAGSPVTLRVFEDGFHVFVGFTLAAESRSVFREVRETIRRSTMTGPEAGRGHEQ
ncbi:alpha/beta hydrolase fold domain-containing protein [Pseudonocardia broussonetiae]|uniref:Alpha/beta hydrolase fold domain-containing protein n=1 Tax=Pseudonocardia broussonetiae TaxID=2736640 RepID=A0A6M6JI44_9PSEU|nr:alpha/beta hydrolase fold domain-containing protein [Pseudonocardia broussonetiae]QJY46061.1 alpha/beta hydrolase fold domain-containing protein [Pseudonocardia broussonetiae]